MNDVVKTDELKKKLKQIESDYKRQSRQICLQGNLQGAQTAAMWTPPPSPRKGKASRKIPKELYKRPCYYIIDFLRQKHNLKHQTLIKKKAREALQNGKKYMIIKQSDFQEKVWFGKNAKELKSKYQNVIYRGLYKLMYGLKFLTIGLKSNQFAQYLNKSPQLKKFNELQNIKIKNENSSYEIINKNLIVPEKLIALHLRKAEKPMKDKMLRMLKQWTKNLK